MKNILHKIRHSRLLTIANVLICILIVASISFFAKDVLSFFYKSSKAKTQDPLLNIQKQQTVRNFSDYEILIRNNPFGYTEAKLSLLLSSNERRGDRENIKLVGTISGSSKYSFAIFADKDNRQEAVRVGKKVFDYGILREVQKNMAVIETDSGRLEIPLQDILNIQEISNTGKGVESPGLIKSMSAGTYVVDKKMILHAIDNPNELMTDARLMPNIVEGKQEGFILREVKSNGLYQKLGLQNGDVLLRINEYNIVNPEAALHAFYAMRGLDRIQLDVIRSGSRMTMTYLIK